MTSKTLRATGKEPSRQHSIDVRVEGSMTCALALLKLVERIEQAPEAVSVIEVDSTARFANGTSETVIVLKPSQSFMDWLSTLGALKVKRSTAG